MTFGIRMPAYGKRPYKSSERKMLDSLRDAYSAAYPSQSEHARGDAKFYSLDKFQKALQSLISTSVDHYPVESLGPLAAHARNMIALLCEYMETRRNRSWLRNGYDDDPVIMFCLETIEFCRYMGSARADEDLLRELGRRLEFLDAIVRQKIFPDEKLYKEGDRTIHQVIYGRDSLHNKLKSDVIPHLERELNARSIRDHASKLRSGLDVYLGRIHRALYYMLPGTKVPLFREDIFKGSNNESYQKIQKSAIGTLLSRLILEERSEYKSEYKSEEKIAYNRMIVVEQTEKEGVKASTSGKEGKTLQLISADDTDHASNPYTDEEGKVALAIRNESMVTVLNESQAFEKFKSDASIASAMRENKEIMKLYIETLGLVYELAKVVPVVEKLHKLSGQGGDFLVSFLGPNYVSGANFLFAHTSTKIEENLNTLWDYVAKRRRDHVDKVSNGPFKTTKVWLENTHNIMSLFSTSGETSIQHAGDSARSCFSDISQEAQRKSSEERVHDMAKVLLDFAACTSNWMASAGQRMGINDPECRIGAARESLKKQLISFMSGNIGLGGSADQIQKLPLERDLVSEKLALTTSYDEKPRVTIEELSGSTDASAGTGTPKTRKQQVKPSDPRRPATSSSRLNNLSSSGGLKVAEDNKLLDMQPKAQTEWRRFKQAVRWLTGMLGLMAIVAGIFLGYGIPAVALGCVLFFGSMIYDRIEAIRQDVDDSRDAFDARVIDTFHDGVSAADILESQAAALVSPRLKRVLEDPQVDELQGGPATLD